MCVNMFDSICLYVCLSLSTALKAANQPQLTVAASANKVSEHYSMVEWHQYQSDTKL